MSYSRPEQEASSIITSSVRAVPNGSTAMTNSLCPIRNCQSLGIVLVLLLCRPVLSQQPSLQSLPATGVTEGYGVVSPTPPGGDAALPADRIIELLREKPELMIDLKKLSAEQLQAQGLAAQEDSITDEMLLGKIVSDPIVRSNITLWLRARGYITTADIQRSKMTPVESDEDDPSQGQLGSPFPLDTSDQATQVLNPRTALIRQGVQGLSVGMEEAGPGIALGTREDTTGRTSVSRERLPSKAPSPEPETRTSNEPELLHRPTPLNLLSMRDLYTQVPEQSSSLKRFGSDVFLSRGMGLKQMPIDLPVGPDYILGPGDGIIITLWGGISEQFTRTVDREGRVVLPEAGPAVVAGLSLEQAQKMIQDALAVQFKDARVEVSITRLRTVRIYIVGDVQRPGAYDLSSLSTPLNALYSAGGPTAIGSLRTVRHYRGKQLIRDVDLYDFLLHGVRTDNDRLEPGDTILVPPVGRQTTISGMVRRPAIYELRNETRLSEVLDLAGGVLVSAEMRQIKVERIQAHENRITLNVNTSQDGTLESSRKAVETFLVQDGDHITVAPILPYSERSIYVDGHVIRPGKYPYRDNMGLIDVLRSYQDLLPEPSDQGEIVRLRPPDYRPETIEFNLPQALIGNEPILLQPFDTIRIFGRYEVDAPTVTIQGEVRRPGHYPLPEDLTAAQLVRMAGGFKRDALLDAADLASYDIKDGRKVVSRRVTINIGRAVKNKDSSADVALKAGDVLTIHQVSGWNDIGASVAVKGEITYPGMYGIQEGEKLSSVLKRAGGFPPGAYPAGAVLLRNQVRELEEKGRTELIRQLETTPPGARLSPSITGQEEIGTLQLIMAQQKQVVEQLKSQPPTGRLVIKISSDISSWENTPADIELRAGDVLAIPKKPSFVLVSGQVYNSAALTFVPGKSAGWYLSHAGGPTSMANKKEIFVIRANGSVVGRDSGGWYSNNVLETKMQPGDVVVVPQKIIGGSNVWRNMLATAQVAANIAITAHVAGF